MPGGGYTGMIGPTDPYGGVMGKAFAGMLGQAQQIQGQKDITGLQTQSQERLGQMGLQGQMAGQASQERQTSTQAEAAKYPATLAQGRFNTVFPWLQGQFGALSQALTGQSGGMAGAYAGAGQPEVSAAPVYSPSQVQSQVNTQRAANDTATAGTVRGTQQRLAGRGVGATSPLAEALGVVARGQGLAASTQGETQTRLGAAQQNAQQVLAGQQARESQYASRQQEDIQRRGIAAQQQSALFAALAGMI